MYLNKGYLIDFFFFNDTATTEIYTLSLHDALPISSGRSTACRRGCAHWWSSRSPIWPTRGRCVAGAGCCTASGTSSAPPARWSASAAGSTESPHDTSITDTLNEVCAAADLWAQKHRVLAGA